MDPFLYKLLIVVLLLIGQGVLWGWVGIQARGLVRWPAKDEWRSTWQYWGPTQQREAKE